MTALTGGVSMTPEIIPVYSDLIRNKMVYDIHVSTAMVTYSMNNHNHSARGNLRQPALSVKRAATHPLKMKLTVLHNSP